MIKDILKNFVDSRKNGTDCLFNGYLEDYLNYDECHEGNFPALFQKIFEIDKDAKICVGLKMQIQKDVVSNQIIGYKDAFKLDGKPIVYPYLVCLEKEGEEKLFLLTSDFERSYLYAKSLYYCMTEPGAIFEQYKNNIIAMSTENHQLVLDAINRCFEMRAGALQRTIDREFYKSYDEMKDDALLEASMICDTVVERLKPLENKGDEIKKTVASWFLLKKLVYVQYMIDKAILQTKHHGDSKSQRVQARTYSKEIAFVAFSELWRCAGDNLPKEDQKHLSQDK